MTFNKVDAEKYNIGYYEGIYEETSISEKELEEAEKSDIFFVGKDKGRLNTIREVKRKFEDNGYRCCIYVTEVNNPECDCKDGIHYNTPLTYRQVVAHVKKTKCILEVLQNGQTGASLRTMEAITYQKNLLTNNKEITDKPFYNSKTMHVYNSIDDVIPSELVKIEKNAHIQANALSFDKFVEHLESKLYKNT